MQQLEIPFYSEARWPRKPYCTDDLTEGLRIRPLKTAFEKRYLQHNPPHLRSFLVFDIDRPGAAYAWEKARLPTPTWVAQNIENGHAHIAYGLRSPVLVDADKARQAPMRFLAAIEDAYRDRLDADPGYRGLITKNPRHADWLDIWETERQLYDLDELAEYVDLTKPPKKRQTAAEKAGEAYGFGRNCVVFDYLRHRAYRLIRDAKERGDYQLWLLQLNSIALTKNAEFRAPLDGREIWHIVKSVGRWTWRHFDIAASDERFSALQAHRGRQGGIKGGAVRSAGYEEQRASARLMHAQGMSARAIARELKCSPQSVLNWVSK